MTLRPQVFRGQADGHWAGLYAGGGRGLPSLPSPGIFHRASRRPTSPLCPLKLPIGKQCVLINERSTVLNNYVLIE